MRLIQTIYLLIISALVVPFTGAETDASSTIDTLPSETFKARHVVKWPSYGIGKIDSYHGQIVMSESEDSKGIMLISPDSYCGDIIVRFEMQPLLPATVMVANLAAADIGTSSLTIADDYDGNVDYMFDNLSMYNFIFHASAHNHAGPFLRRFPRTEKRFLSPASQHYTQTGQYSAVEIGREGDRLWLAIDGEDVVDWRDPEPLPGGHVVLRLRGTVHERGAALIRNLQIANDPSETDCH